MTDAETRMKLIAEFERCIAEHVPCEPMHMMVAVALLKAQEPRVMTLEEYEAWIDTPFTERNPVFHEERTKRGTVTCWVNTVVCTLREYGKNDRCWTSHPDEKRRAETPWQQ